MSEGSPAFGSGFDQVVNDAVQADFRLELDTLADEYLSLDPEKRTGFLLRKIGEIATAVYGDDHEKCIDLTRILIDQFGNRMVLRAQHPETYPGEIESWRLDDYPNRRYVRKKNND